MRHDSNTHASDNASEHPLMLPIRLLVSGITTAMLQRQRRADFRSLSSMSDHELKDIGVSRADIYRETGQRVPRW